MIPRTRDNFKFYNPRLICYTYIQFWFILLAVCEHTKNGSSETNTRIDTGCTDGVDECTEGFHVETTHTRSWSPNKFGVLPYDLFFCYCYPRTILALPPSSNSDPGSHSGPSSPLPTTVHAFIFIARRSQHFLPSSTRVEFLCIRKKVEPYSVGQSRDKQFPSH